LSHASLAHRLPPPCVRHSAPGGAALLSHPSSQGQADYAHCHFGYFGGILGTFTSIGSLHLGCFGDILGTSEHIGACNFG
jgi:hypothetical protein